MWLILNGFRLSATASSRCLCREHILRLIWKTSSNTHTTRVVTLLPTLSFRSFGALWLSLTIQENDTCFASSPAAHDHLFLDSKSSIPHFAFRYFNSPFNTWEFHQTKKYNYLQYYNISECWYRRPTTNCKHLHEFVKTSRIPWWDGAEEQAALRSSVRSWIWIELILMN